MPNPFNDREKAKAFNAERLLVVVEFIKRCQELGVGFGNEVLVATKVDALVNALLGPMELDEEGNLTQGTAQRVEFELDFAQRMLEQVNTAGVEAALIPNDQKLYMPGTGLQPNRAQRRAKR